MIIVGIDEMDVRQYLVGTLICSLGWLLYRWNLQIVGTSLSARAGLKGHKTVQLANGAFYKAGSLRHVKGGSYPTLSRTPQHAAHVGGLGA